MSLNSASHICSQVGLIQELVSTAADLTGTMIPADAPLMSAGLDSIGATEFSTSISERLSTELSQTLLFDHPSLRSIAASLADVRGPVPALEPCVETLDLPRSATRKQV